MAEIRQCSKCGCSQDNACQGGCSWVLSDVCSRCIEKDEVALKIPMVVAIFLFQFVAVALEHPEQCGVLRPFLETFINQLGRVFSDAGLTEEELLQATMIGLEEQPRIIVVPG